MLPMQILISSYRESALKIKILILSSPLPLLGFHIGIPYVVADLLTVWALDLAGKMLKPEAVQWIVVGGERSDGKRGRIAPVLT